MSTQNLSNTSFKANPCVFKGLEKGKGSPEWKGIFNGKALSERAAIEKGKGLISFVTLQVVVSPFPQSYSSKNICNEVEGYRYERQRIINLHGKTLIVEHAVTVVIQNRLMTTNQSTSVYQTLLNSGMAHWIPALMFLLHHYEGIERAMEPEEQPLNYLAEKLKQINTTPTADREQLFFDVVATMPLFYYRAATKEKSWNPQSESFCQFESHGNTVSIWQEWTPHLSRNEIKNWLYANLPVSSNARITA